MAGSGIARSNDRLVCGEPRWQSDVIRFHRPIWMAALCIGALEIWIIPMNG
jgi:hypothetical protein